MTIRTQRQWASCRLSELIRLSMIMRASGEILPVRPWLLHLGHTLASAPTGNLKISKGHKGKQSKWEGLDFLTLKQAARHCGFECSDDEIADALKRVTDWRAQNPGTFIRGLTIAKALGVSAAVRREARAWTIGAVDETPEQRKAMRSQKNRQRHIKRRAAAGAVTRSINLSKTQPWKELGMSRASWYRKQRETNETSETKRTQDIKRDNNCVRTVSTVQREDAGISSLLFLAGGSELDFWLVENAQWKCSEPSVGVLEDA